MKPNEVVKKLKTASSKNAPIILTSIGITGMVASTVLAVKSTPKALDIIREAEQEKGEELPKKEVIKVAWKPYMPAVGTAIFSIACIIGAHSIHAKRGAALAAAYKLSQSALHEFKTKTVEVVGEENVKKIKDELSKDKINKKPSNNAEVIITEKGEHLCFEPISGRYFKSSVNKIKEATVEANMHMLNNEYISLNTFYSMLGLDHTKNGYDLGWAISKGKLNIDFGSIIADDGTPTIAIQYDDEPYYGYDRLI